jgi:hypothetical protein
MICIPYLSYLYFILVYILLRCRQFFLWIFKLKVLGIAFFPFFFYFVFINCFPFFLDTVVKTIIAGIIQIDITGYNLGHNALRDILSVTVTDTKNGIGNGNGGQPPIVHECSGLIRYNSSALRCLLHQETALPLLSFTASDDNDTKNDFDGIDPFFVEVRTISGVVRGISLDVKTQLIGKTFRPLITGVTARRIPFQPTAVQVIEEDNCLYWTNSAGGVRALQRSKLDGTAIETLVTRVRKGSSVVVLPALLDDQLNYLNLKNNNNNEGATTAANCSSSYFPLLRKSGENVAFTDNDHEQKKNNCVYSGHVLFFTDSDNGTVSQVNVLPISSDGSFTFLLEDSSGSSSVGSGNGLVCQNTALNTAEESARIFSNPIHHKVLFQGMNRISSVALDLDHK